MSTKKLPKIPKSANVEYKHSKTGVRIIKKKSAEKVKAGKAAWNRKSAAEKAEIRDRLEYINPNIRYGIDNLERLATDSATKAKNKSAKRPARKYKTTARAEAMRNYWENMSPTERKERLAERAEARRNRRRK